MRLNPLNTAKNLNSLRAMLGVQFSAPQAVAVAEFFELLKVPWEPLRPAVGYRAIISFSGESPAEAPPLLLLSSPQPTEWDRRNEVTVGEPRPGRRLRFGGASVPLSAASAALAGPGAPLLSFAPDGAAALLRHRDGEHITLRLGIDLAAEVAQRLTAGQPAADAAAPTLDHLVDLVRRLLVQAGIPLLEVAAQPQGAPCFACVTHDVDHPSLRRHGWDHTAWGFLRRALVDTPLDVAKGRRPARDLLTNLSAAARLPAVQFGWSEDPWLDFGQYVDREPGMGSTFFVLPQSGTPGVAREGGGPAPVKRAAAYGATDLAPLLDRLRQRGAEIALHGIDAWHDAESGRRERDAFDFRFHCGERGVRMHWLYFSADAPRVLEDAGFTYDATGGYNGTVGFRHGTAQVFRPPGATRLLELPLHVMDTALFYPGHLHLTPEAAWARVLPLVDATVRLGGALTLNWHDRSLFPERLWGDFHARLVTHLQSLGARLAPAAAVVAWFRRRRAVLFRYFDGSDSLVAVAPPLPFPELPALRLRRFAPGNALLGDSPALVPTLEFTDSPL